MLAIQKIDPNDRSFDAFVSSCLAQTSWGSRRNDGRLPSAISKSHMNVCLLSGEPVGFIRIITDGSYFGFVSEIFVLEECRNSGIGAMLLKSAIDAPELQSIDQWLLVSREHSKFFEKHSFGEVLRGRVFFRRRKKNCN
jgi:N-acetylglutamate synthase-like GNAT family acetyltransferase